MFSSCRLALALLVLAAPAAAQVSDRLDPVHVDGRWEAVPFGQGIDECTAFMERSLRWRLREELSTRDPAARDKLVAKIDRDAKAFRETVVTFTGQRTGYNLSVINTDFAHDANESMASVAVDKAHDYYFFQNGHLWRLVTADASRQSFSSLLVTLTAALGPPASITYANEATKTEPLSARWSSDVFTVEAEAKPEFSTRVVRWTWRSVGDSIATLRAGKVPPGLQKPDELDPAILDIMNP